MADIVNLISSDEEEDSTVRKRPRTQLSRTQPQLDTAIDGDDEDEDLQVVSCIIGRPKSSHPNNSSSNIQEKLDPPAGNTSNKPHEATTSIVHQEGDQLEVTESRRGVQALVDFAHFRHQCITKPFKRQRAQRKLLFCEKCFCYVCDIPADKCAQWEEHCKASDSQATWRNQRKIIIENRKKMAVNPSQRGSIYATVTNPQVIHNLVSDSDSNGDDDVAISDIVECTDWYPTTTTTTTATTTATASGTSAAASSSCSSITCANNSSTLGDSTRGLNSVMTDVNTYCNGDLQNIFQQSAVRSCITGNAITSARVRRSPVYK